MNFNISIIIDPKTFGCSPHCSFLDKEGNKESESENWCLLFKEEVILIKNDQWEYDRCITCQKVINNSVIAKEILNIQNR